MSDELGIDWQSVCQSLEQERSEQEKEIDTLRRRLDAASETLRIIYELPEVEYGDDMQMQLSDIRRWTEKALKKVGYTLQRP